MMIMPCLSPSGAQHSTKFTAKPPKLVSLYFDCTSAPVWRIVATTLSSETRWVPSPCSASDAAAIALTAPKAFRCRLAYPSRKSVNRIPDNFLPKTRDGLMIGGPRDWRTTGLGLKEKISDCHARLSGRRIGRAASAAKHTAEQVGRTLPLAKNRA